MKHKIIYLFLLIWSFTNAQNKIVSEDLLITNDSIQLPGTLSYSDNKSPLIIWVHGSGNVDRNGNQGATVKANYIQQFREKMNANGFAFFSYDKRTSNPKNFKYSKGILFDDLVNDIKKVINHFKNDVRFSKIVLIGHSQGSLTAMLATTKHVHKYISLAGLSNTFDKTLIKQVSKQNPALGKTAEAHFKELFETGEIKQVHPFLANIFKKENHPFLINWAKYNPSKEIKKLKTSVLIINGDKDIQVKVEDAQALHKALPTSEIAIIKNMNHVLKHIEKDTDNMNSYYSANFKLSKELITTIVVFLKK